MCPCQANAGSTTITTVCTPTQTTRSPTFEINTQDISNMRLINCSTLQLEEFFDRAIPEYAILSHTWGHDEVSFADAPFSQATTAREAWKKIEFTCAQASRDGLSYVWVDTCCIDKSSSSELSEAINSMFAWYKNSARCYAYLSDVLVANITETFSKSRWFTRGWTLQELLAPMDVIFYDQQWSEIGTRVEHAEWISEITGIDAGALANDMWVELGFLSVAQKMSWASHRQTTRPEDIAYCLLGIFSVSMPLLYGEGDRAFLRLQEEIIRRTDDDSILAWNLRPEMDHPLGLVSDTVKADMASGYGEQDVLATSPLDFKNCANLEYIPGSTSPFTLTNVGLQIQLPLIPVYRLDDDATSTVHCGWIGLLSCSSGKAQEFLGIPLVLDVNDNGHGVQRMSRIASYDKKTNAATLIVGPQAAVRSVPRKIVISRNGLVYTEIDRFYPGHQLVIVNKPSNLQEMGYRVKNVTKLNITQANGDVGDRDPCWNPEALSLTIQNGVTKGFLVEFCFEQLDSEQNSKFAIFMHTASSRAIVRKGDTFSKDERRSFYEYLINQTTQDDTDNITIPGREGHMFRVSARIHQTRVYIDTIFEVIVKAIRVVPGARA
jgi:hypothetical protein